MAGWREMGHEKPRGGFYFHLNTLCHTTVSHAWVPGVLSSLSHRKAWFPLTTIHLPPITLGTETAESKIPQGIYSTVHIVDTNLTPIFRGHFKSFWRWGKDFLNRRWFAQPLTKKHCSPQQQKWHNGALYSEQSRDSGNCTNGLLLQGGYRVRNSRIDSRHTLSCRISCEWIYTLNPTPALLLSGQACYLFPAASLPCVSRHRRRRIVPYRFHGVSCETSLLTENSEITPQTPASLFYGFCGGKSQLISTLPWSCYFHDHTSLHFLVSIRTNTM